MMILHIPHASIETLGKKFLCDVDLELERMTDIGTDRLFNYPDATKIIFPISRLLCDVERFEDDVMEEMAKKGMGVCYTTNSFGKPLRVIHSGEREEIIEKYYRPHHQALSEAVEDALQKRGNALIVDCHSFSNLPLPHENSQTTPRPHICIGTDDYHTSEILVTTTVKFFEDCGYSVAVNNPFSGTLIPMKYYHLDQRVEGIMIEVNRDLYKDDFSEVQNNILRLLSILNIKYL